MTTDPGTLMDRSACFRCLGPGNMESIEAYLLCQWLNNKSGSINLLNSLFAYWNLNEAAGVRADSLGVRNLTNNGVSAVAGMISNGILGVPPTGNLVYNGLQSDFEFVGSAFTFCAWVKLTDKATDYSIVGPYRAAITRSWRMHYSKASDAYVFNILNNGAVVAPVAPVIGTYAFVAWWNDLTNSYIQINNGTIVSAAVATPLPGAADFKIGSDHSDVNPFNGAVDEVGVWNRVLNAAERSALYNSGAGKTYPFT